MQPPKSPLDAENAVCVHRAEHAVLPAEHGSVYAWIEKLRVYHRSIRQGCAKADLPLIAVTTTPRCAFQIACHARLVQCAFYCWRLGG